MNTTFAVSLTAQSIGNHAVVSTLGTSALIPAPAVQWDTPPAVRGFGYLGESICNDVPNNSRSNTPSNMRNGAKALGSPPRDRHR